VEEFEIRDSLLRLEGRKRMAGKGKTCDLQEFFIFFKEKEEIKNFRRIIL